MDKLTYVSLFSSAGIGCYGFKQQDFDCILTCELIERRMEIQKVNNKCNDVNGYLCGDITKPEIKNYAIEHIQKYKNINNCDIDVVVATPPCQGMSVANGKKNDRDIIRNSLVLEAINMVQCIAPRFFVFENVPSFMKTKCGQVGQEKEISQVIADELGSNYIIDSKVINFKDYGANSSRSRCLVIGIRKDLNIELLDIWPSKEKSKTMRELIFNLPRLNIMGEISDSDIYHNFKAYKSNMREWIKDLKEGKNAFDNIEPSKQPHQIKNGIMIPNVKKNGDKYCRQIWDKTPPCVHTRSDIFSSQNTIHPVDDRVFSIRELMIFMNVPSSFKWTNNDEKELNEFSLIDKKAYLKKNEANIRQSLGEAVPTIIFSKIAKNIKDSLSKVKK